MILLIASFCVKFVIWCALSSENALIFVIRCAIWYYLWKLKSVKNTHGGLLILVKLQVEACNFTKTNTPPWVFFTFSKLYKWCQTAQRITFFNIHYTFILSTFMYNFNIRPISYFLNNWNVLLVTVIYCCYLCLFE